MKVKVKSFSRVRLCDPVDRSPPGSSVHGILQARILEWVAISFSMGSSTPRDQMHISSLAGRFLNTEPPGRVRLIMLNIVAMLLFTDLFILTSSQISRFRTALPFFMAKNYSTIILYYFGKHDALLLFFIIYYFPYWKSSVV